MLTRAMGWQVSVEMWIGGKPKMRLQGISSGVQWAKNKQTPDHKGGQGSSQDAPLAHRRPGYPSSGCSPAEPDSVSPDATTVTEAVGANKARSERSGEVWCCLDGARPPTQTEDLASPRGKSPFGPAQSIWERTPRMVTFSGEATRPGIIVVVHHQGAVEEQQGR